MSTWDTLTKEQLEMLPTHRLLAVYKLMIERRGRMSYDAFESGRIEESEYYKLDGRCELVKAELNTREHVERDKSQAERKYPRSKQALARADRSLRSRWSYEKEIVHAGPTENLDDCIGLQVFKKSKKPFKSGNAYNTVKTVTVNPHTDLAAFTFEEDTSVVDAHICIIRKGKNHEISNA